MKRQKKKIMTAAVLTGAALGTTYAIMRHIAKKPINTFTIGIKTSDDESKRAKLMAEHIGSHYHE